MVWIGGGSFAAYILGRIFLVKKRCHGQNGSRKFAKKNQENSAIYDILDYKALFIPTLVLITLFMLLLPLFYDPVITLL